jgi:sodium pump decarboxylase gamma subunit
MINVLTLAVESGTVLENFKKWAGTVTLSGLLIVFAMLILLVILIMVFGKIMQSLSGEAKPKAPVQTAKVTPIAKPSVSVVEDDTDGEIIAAISAAVMMMYEGTGVVPVIRSVKRAQSGSFNAWRAAGIANNTRSF